MSERQPSLRQALVWWVAGLVAFVSTVFLLAWSWRGGLPYDSSSGVWATLADDVAHGELYRGVDGPAGYGGTRYMPLFFGLHGALIHAGWPVMWSGLFLTIASLTALLAGAYFLMRQLGAARSFAGPATLLVTASISCQLLGLSIKGDFLAAALNVGGVVLALRGADRGREWMLRIAGVVFAAAMLTKFTEVFALTTIVIWLVRRREWRQTIALVIPFVLAVATGLTLANWLSAGKMADAFSVCATGGLKLSYAWRFPFWFARVAGEDPFFVAIALGGAVLSVRRWHRIGADIVVLFFAVTALGTMLMFASPGTDSNHLIDLLVASLVVIAVEVSSSAVDSRVVTGAPCLVTAAILIMWIPGAPSVFHFLQARGRPTTAAVEEIVRRLPPGSSDRWLSENPIVPLATGQRPAVLDCFSLRLLAARSTKVRQEFFARLQQQHYSAVILIDWSGVPLDQRWREIDRHTSLGVNRFYGEVHFPAGFLEALQADYRLSFVVAPFVVFEPRGRVPTKTQNVSLTNSARP